MPILRDLRAWCLLAALGIGVAVAAEPEVAVAAGSSKKSGSTSKKKKASTTKKSSASSKGKSAGSAKSSSSAKPQLRPAEGPVAVAGEGDDEAEGEAGEDEAGADEGGKTPEQEQAEIDAEFDGGAPAEPVEAEPPPPPVDNTPRWVEHEVIPYENVEAVAGRYGVSVKEIVKWNKLDPKKPRLRSGKTIKIKAKNPPPPREKIEYEIQKGDNWEKIAGEHGVDVKTLKRWNPAKKDPKTGKQKPVMIAGKSLRIWVEPAILGGGSGDAGSGPPSAEAEGRLLAAKVRANAISIGAPTRGRLVNGVVFPELPDLYTLRKPEQSFGSSHTVKTAVQAINAFRRGSRYSRELVIGAVSLARGGRFRPHKSHQSGRDIDIRLPIRASVEHKNAPSPGEVDWRATWKLIEAFVATGEVQYIFLEYRLQKSLYKAARAAGVPAKDLAAVIQWPRPAKSNNGIVRHAKGHTSHIHVRVKCGPAESKCESGR
ncbi:MAG: penicillin-insensitive murein endopeptidase [Myxococcales bacterium]|nr:penicillin-insensitive murein endopeptidase [Myxococcales bacterium]